MKTDNLLTTPLWARLATPTAALQVWQLLRYASVLLAGVVLGRLVGLGPQLESWESLWLLGTALTFALRTGIANHYLPARERLPEPLVTANSRFLGNLLAVVSTLLYLPLGYRLTGGNVSLLFPLAVYHLVQTATLLAEFEFFAHKRVRQLYGLGLMGFGLPVAALAGLLHLGFSLKDAAWVFALLYLFRWGYCLGATGELTPTLRPADWAVLRQQGYQLLPLAGVALAAGSGEYLDGFLVWWLDPDAFVLYRYGARELPLTLLLATVTAVGAAGRIAAQHTQGQDLTPELNLLRRQTLHLLWLTAPVSLLLLLVARPLFAAVYGPAFQPAGSVFALFLLLNLPRLLMPQAILNGLGLNQIQFRVSLAELALRLGLTLALVPWIGAWGAAISTVLAYSVEKALLIWQVHQHGIRMGAYVPLGWWVVYCLLLSTFWLLVEGLPLLGIYPAPFAS